MTEILTITFNPCIDKSTTIAALKPESKLRCTPPVFEPGGGGINVARAIKLLGGEALAIYPTGGYSGKFLNILLEREDIPLLNIETSKHTRENMIVLDKATNQQYRFGMPGQHLEESEWMACLDAIENNESSFIVVSGSLPPGVPADIIARIAKIAKKQNRKLIVDSSGEALRLAVDEDVYLIKPNLGELSRLVGKESITSNEIEPIAKELINNGKCEIVVVSMGPLGAMLISKDVTYKVVAPLVKKQTTVGAGDCMVAGIVLFLSQGKNLLEALKYGVACGTAATLSTGTKLCKREDAEGFYELINERKDILTK